MSSMHDSIGARLCAVALLLAMCAGRPAIAGGLAVAEDSAAPNVGADRVASTLPGRASHSRVRRPAAVAELQSRLDALGVTDSGALGTGPADCESAYVGHKAQAWLNFAEYAAQSDAPASVRTAALQNARDLVSALESHAASTNGLSELPGSQHVRDDLWRSVAAVKADGRRCAAPKMTAYCEVQLAWVGYEASVGGWRHVDPYVRIAEDYCATATRAVPKIAQTVPPIAVTPISQPAREDVAAAISDEIELSIDVLFEHGRWRSSEMLEPAHAMIAKLAKHMDDISRNMFVIVVGHADVTGGSRYNETLSARRANTVAKELKRYGVDAARISVRAVGSTDPLVSCSRSQVSSAGGATPAARRARYWACLEPNRRVVVRLVAQ